MNKQNFLYVILGLLLLSLGTACSNDEIVTDGGQVNVATGMEFPVTFADYNEEEQVGNTRATANESDTVGHQIVDMGNGIVADVTIRKDYENLSSKSEQATRAIPNDQYTMLAYQSGVLKGEVTGNISGNTFTPSGATTSINLSPGNYDFVLYPTGSFTRSGNNLTTSSVSEQTMIGRASYTVTSTPNKQKVPFVMKHVAARVRIRFSTYIAARQYGPTPNTIQLDAVNSAELPNNTTYDAVAGTWSYDGTKNNFAKGYAYNFYPETKMIESSETGPIGSIYQYTYPNYSYVIPAPHLTKLKATLNGLTIYKETFNNKSFTFTPSPALDMVANGSYLVNITMRYNFVYLMHDGTTGLLTETTYGGGTKTPIGLVVSQSKRLAVALTDLGLFKWSDGISGQANSQTFQSTQLLFSDQTKANDPSGYKWTWEPSGSYDGVTIKANDQTHYPAFYAAAHYTPTLPSGVNLTGSIVGKKWYLPSLGEIMYLCTGIDKTGTLWQQRFSTGGSMLMADWPLVVGGGYGSGIPLDMFLLAIKQVGGNTTFDRYRNILSSSETSGIGLSLGGFGYGNGITLHDGMIDQCVENYVWPFVNY